LQGGEISPLSVRLRFASTRHLSPIGGKKSGAGQYLCLSIKATPDDKQAILSLHWGKGGERQ